MFWPNSKGEYQEKKEKMGTIVIWLNVELILSLDIMITYEQDTDLRSKTELYFVSEVLCYLEKISSYSLKILNQK